ncbi:hypothetical protein ACQ3I4_13290 [Zafaria sp. Z1313]|uniref:hypothetical protein n=1 Tax=unclassified Zafaria TaxID=2828765 RepID=UPI002E76B929|nr:hypothetical protein [Zafaria sp. J156]MEE1621436.1 hypothetical protein [Zafaria sp. J156]
MAEWNREWASEQWQAGVREWISMVLDTYSLAQTGPLEQKRIRLWSTQIVVPTDHGRLYFKANNPGQQGEASVTATAANLAPEQLVMPLAIEPARGWMISPDYGDTLTSLPSTDYQLWVRLVCDFARLQLELVPFGDTLFDAGLLHMDPAWLPAYIDEQLVLHASMPPEHPLHLPARDAEDLHRQLDVIHGMCDYLAAGPVPLTLEHNDLHRNNTFLPSTPDEPLRFMDLGDAYWAHPFSSLGRPIAAMCEELGTTPSDPRIRRVVTAYLEQWREYGTVEQLRPYVEPALRIGKMQAHGTWMRILSGADEDELRRYAHLTLRPLAELIQPVLG